MKTLQNRLSLRRYVPKEDDLYGFAGEHTECMTEGVPGLPPSEIARVPEPCTTPCAAA